MQPTQYYTMTHEINLIMDNLENIQSFKKHGTNISQMKWVDYAKGSVNGKMDLLKEWKEQILFMSSVLKTYQRAV